jgi:hypothetical protein
VIVFTPQHRMIAFSLHPGRKYGSQDADRLKLFQTAVTYSGKFRVEPGRYVVTIEWSSTALNQGEAQIRYHTLDGDTLHITIPEQLKHLRCDQA